MPVDLRLLGPFEAWSGHGRLNVGGASQQALLAALALQVGQTVPVERLAGVLWEGRPPASYRQQLYKRVHALRSVLGAAAIATDESGYRLDVAPACSDLHRFSEQVTRARRAQSKGRFSEALELFRKALSTWRRPALDGIASQVLRAEGARLDEKRALIVKECQELEQKPDSPESASRPPPACLPMDMPSFTGRSSELAALDREPSTGVVITTITGTAGVGKTALAVHWAHRARHLFPDGQLYVNLRGFDRSAPMAPGEALTLFLRELGAPSERIPPDTDAQSLLYRSIVDGKRLLVVLDNAATMEQVEPLLPGSQGCMVLVTSRNALTGLVALHDAGRILLDTLTAAESSELLRRILGEHDPAAAARLAELCGHLPLALRIAAATIATSHHTSIADLVDRLSSPDRLTHLKIDGVPRASVAAAFDLSYRAVRPETQDLLRLLSIAPGPDITPDAASALCGAPAEHLLTELAAMHLVEQYRPGRYRLHDLVTLYAQNLCATTETAAINALLTYYVHSADAATTAVSAVRRLTPRPFRPVRAREFATAQEALDWLSSERENLVASAGWAHEHGADVLCVHLVDALRGFFWVQRRKGDWLAVGELGLASARRLADPAMEALMHRTLGRACIALERLDDALDHSLTAVRLWEQAQDWDAAAGMRLDVSLVYRANCRLDLAANHAGQALGYARTHGRDDLEVAALNALFDCEMGQGRLGWTVRTASRSLESPAADEQLQAHAYAARGWALHEMGMLPEAQRDLAASVDLHDRCGNRESGVLQRAYLGRVHLDAGDYEQAVRVLEYARDELRDLVPHWECVAVHGLALASFRLGDLEEALRLELDAVDIARTRDFPPALIEALVGLGRIRLALGGAAADAAALAQDAIDLSERHGWRLHLGEAHHVLAEASLAAGHTDEARAHATTALDLHRTIGQRLREEENLALLARIK